MFTGLIDDIGQVTRLSEKGEGRSLRIATSYALEHLVLGASIACAGICLTVTARGTDDGRNWFEVDASAETLAKTTLGNWKAGQRINLEKSLRMGDPLGGHLVSGHVDGMALLKERRDDDGCAAFAFEAPSALSRFIAQKGSVTLDGTSLTVNAVEGDTFTVMLIPHTLAVTTWGEAKAEDRVNLEVDMLARYVARLHETQSAGQASHS